MTFMKHKIIVLVIDLFEMLDLVTKLILTRGAIIVFILRSISGFAIAP